MNIDLILETIGYVGNNKDYSISERLSLIEELVAIIKQLEVEVKTRELELEHRLRNMKG